MNAYCLLCGPDVSCVGHYAPRLDYGAVPTLADYQRLAMRTHHNSERLSPDGLPLYCCLGLAGEAGELVDKIKKAWRNQTPLDREAALRELGDVLWYVTAIAVELGSSLEQVAGMNVAKLADRQARGVIKSEGDDR